MQGKATRKSSATNGLFSTTKVFRIPDPALLNTSVAKYRNSKAGSHIAGKGYIAGKG
jgi:hypothetical protein